VKKGVSRRSRRSHRLKRKKDLRMGSLAEIGLRMTVMGKLANQRENWRDNWSEARKRSRIVRL